jgi:hypothetical protein
MAYYHFLIDLSLSNQDFQQQKIYMRLIEQIDYLIEINQERTSKDRVGFTFFSSGIIFRTLDIPLQDFRDLIRKPLSFEPGSAILDSIAKTTSYLEEVFKVEPLQKKLLIFSDFEENASWYYTVESVGEIILEFSERYGWDFFAFGIKNYQIPIFLRMNFNLENLILLPT